MSSVNKQVVKFSFSVQRICICLLATIAIFGIFATGFDSGQLEQAFGISSEATSSTDATGVMWLHEFAHDARHAAGFMCH